MRIRHANGPKPAPDIQVLAIVDLIFFFVSETCLISHDMLLMIIERRNTAALM
jgi:hypothetical protein